MTQSVPKTASPKKPCPGIIVDIPPGKSALTSYPFVLHEWLGNPWDISLSGSLLILRAQDCSNIPSIHDSKCIQCINLSKNSTLQGILNRISDGVNENFPFHFHGLDGMIEIMWWKTGQIQALKLNHLGDVRKLIWKANAIDLYKKWVMAINSGKVEQVDRLAKVALANNRGIRGLLDLYNCAAHDVYHTKSYDEDDMLRGLLLWRLGGAQVADIAHRSLGLPALCTLRRHTVLPWLIASPGQPTLQEIEANTITCLEPISKIVSGSEHKVVHQVVMFDKLKVEECPRWDDHTNYIQGVCREYGHHASLFYTSNQEVDLLLEQILEEKVHLTSNATVGAIGILSDNHQLYSALSVLISGQCQYFSVPHRFPQESWGIDRNPGESTGIDRNLHRNPLESTGMDRNGLEFTEID